MKYTDADSPNLDKTIMNSITKRDTTYRLFGYLMIIAASVLFGVNGNLSRLLLDDGISPVTLVELRMLIGGASLFIIMGVGWRKGLKLPSAHLGWLVAFGFSLALVTYCYFVAISRLPLAIALVIQFSATTWMALGEALWKRCLPSVTIFTAVILNFGGMILLTEVWQQNLKGLDRTGLLYATLALGAYIAYLLLGRRVGCNIPALPATAYGALIASIFWLAVQPPWSIPATTWQPHHVLLIILVGIIGMAIPFSLVLASLRRIDAMRVGITSMLELASAGIIAYFWLGQRLDFWQIIGCVLVFLGIIILQFEKLTKAEW